MKHAVVLSKTSTWGNTKSIDYLKIYLSSLARRTHVDFIGFVGERSRLVKQFAWAIPTEEVLAKICAWSPIIEVGAGTGYWAKLLADRGADVVAYDKQPGHNHWCDNPCYYKVRVGGPREARRYPDRTLFLCWPPMSPMAAQALEAFSGTKLVYIGEGSGGCCADSDFFELINGGWDLVKEVPIPQWPALHDRALFYKLRS